MMYCSQVESLISWRRGEPACRHSLTEQKTISNGDLKRLTSERWIPLAIPARWKMSFPSNAGETRRTSTSLSTCAVPLACDPKNLTDSSGTARSAQSSRNVCSISTSSFSAIHSPPCTAPLSLPFVSADSAPPGGRVLPGNGSGHSPRSTFP